MAVGRENSCVGCPAELGCLGDACPNRQREVHYCDKCDEQMDLDEIYEVDGYELCLDCLKERFKRSW